MMAIITMMMVMTMVMMMMMMVHSDAALRRGGEADTGADRDSIWHNLEDGGGWEAI